MAEREYRKRSRLDQVKWTIYSHEEDERVVALQLHFQGKTHLSLFKVQTTDPPFGTDASGFMKLPIEVEDTILAQMAAASLPKPLPGTSRVSDRERERHCLSYAQGRFMPHGVDTISSAPLPRWPPTAHATHPRPLSNGSPL